MIQKFTTKRDDCGNRCTLIIDHDSKTFLRGYNVSFDYSDFITISKKDHHLMIDLLASDGYRAI